MPNSLTSFLKLSTPLLALAVVFALVSGTFAADQPTNQSPNNALTLKGVSLGTHVYGPPTSTEALAGKVVVFEYWGDRCPPCIRAIPHLNKLQAKHKDNLVIVANQVWTKDVDAAKKAWTNAGGSDQITVINHGGVKGAQPRGVPHAFVFDHTGTLLWSGHPANKKLDETVAKAINAIPKQS